MLLEEGRRLNIREIPDPKPTGHQLLLKVSACALCRTDLHILDGELTPPHFPLILGHQVVGTVAALGPDAARYPVGARVGVAWLGSSCGRCDYCSSGFENLCDNAQFTGFDLNGGLATYCVADERFVYPLPATYSDETAAPLLCAGMIGYRSLKLTGDAKTIGFYGFGSAAHLLTPAALYQKRTVYAFTRPGDKEGQRQALALGAAWAGDSTEIPPQLLDAAIIFAPVGALVPLALKAVKKGGSVVCAGIHMSDIPSFPYSLLWGERVLRSVANLTRKDGNEWLDLAPRVPIRPKVTVYPLERTFDAFDAIRSGKIDGSAVIKL